MIKQHALSVKGKLAATSGAAIIFFLSKSAVLFAPLLLSNVVSVEQYGLFEYALGIGSISSILFAAGLPGAVPFFLIRQNRPDFIVAFHAHAALLSLILIGSGCALLLTPQPSPLTFGFSVGALMACQAIHATISKSNSHPARASVIESGFYLVLLIAIVLSLLLESRFDTKTMLGVFNLYGLALLALSARSLRAEVGLPNLVTKYQEVFQFGIPLILSSLMIVALANGGRVLVNTLLSAEAGGVYSFIFRLSATVLIAHQLINTLFFRPLYESNPKSLDKYFCLVSSLIISLSAFVFLTSPLIPTSILQLSSILPVNREVQLIISYQMVFWVSTALLENIIYRSRIGNRFSATLAIIVPTLILAVLALKQINILNLETLCLAYSIAVFATLMSQLFLLHQAGVTLKRFWFLSILTMLSLIVFIALI